MYKQLYAYILMSHEFHILAERLAVEKEHDTKKVDHYSRLGKSTVNAHTIVQLSARTSKDKDKDIETTAV